MMANKMRLIDANALRQRMFSYYSCVDENSRKEYYKGETLMSYEVADMIEDCIDNAPAVDAVPVVRCEKCLYSSQYCDENGMYKCGGIQNENGDCFLMVEPTHFCAFGKWRGKFGAKMDGGNENG